MTRYETPAGGKPTGASQAGEPLGHRGDDPSHVTVTASLIADNAATIARCTFPDQGLRLLLDAAGVTR